MLKEMNSLQFGEFTLDRRARELRRGEAVLSVSGKAFDLLAYMVENPGRPLLKSELLDAVWPETSVEESNLSQNVFLLRKVLGAGGDGPIKTLPGRGYQFTAQVKEIVESSPSGAGAPTFSSVSTVTMETTSTRMVMEGEVEQRWSWNWPRSKSIFYFSLVAATLFLAYLGWLLWEQWQDHTGGPPLTVVLTTMDGTTGDPVLDRSLMEAFRIDLAQSPFVSTLSAATVRATLTQMSHKPDDAVTADLAREICERTNSQAVIRGTVARMGQHFLLTEEASNCVDGKILAAAKQESEKAEDLPHSIDKLAASLREKLGESHRSIARFNTPLFADTASLDALKAYTQGTDANRKGETAQSIALFKTAIAADPKFATAYYGLYTSYNNAGDHTASRAALAQAYALRNTTSRMLQFAITEAYSTTNTEDMYEGLMNLQNWTKLYPNSMLAWNRLYTTYTDFGRYTEAVAAGQRALNLVPLSQVLSQCLATAQMQSGDVQAAQSTLDKTIADHLDGEMIRIRYLELAYLLHDETMLRNQRQWAASHPEATSLVLGEIRIAIAEGRFSDARKLIAQLRELKRRQGVEGAGDEFAKAEAVELMEAGDVDEGKRIFESIPVNLEEGQEVVGLGYAGNFSAAQAAVGTMLAKYPKGTLWHLYWSPQVGALVDLANGKPADAAAVLETSRPVERRELMVPWLRGQAYLAAQRPNAAEIDFRSVVDHPQFDPTSPTISLSWLGLGRALKAENKTDEARVAYQHFLASWAHADPDAAYLKQAKQEFAALEAAPAAPHL